MEMVAGLGVDVLAAVAVGWDPVAAEADCMEGLDYGQLGWMAGWSPGAINLDGRQRHFHLPVDPSAMQLHRRPRQQTSDDLRLRMHLLRPRLTRVVAHGAAAAGRPM